MTRATVRRPANLRNPMAEEEEQGDSPDEDDAQQFEIVLEPQHLAGVWANFARVSQSIHEFTLDFIRHDSTTQKGIVDARVSVSPLFVSQLIGALQQEWTKYERRAMPKEIYDDEQDDGPKT